MNEFAIVMLIVMLRCVFVYFQIIFRCLNVFVLFCRSVFARFGLVYFATSVLFIQVSASTQLPLTTHHSSAWPYGNVPSRRLCSLPLHSTVGRSLIIFMLRDFYHFLLIPMVFSIHIYGCTLCLSYSCWFFLCRSADCRVAVCALVTSFGGGGEIPLALLPSTSILHNFIKLFVLCFCINIPDHNFSFWWWTAFIGLHFLLN